MSTEGTRFNDDRQPCVSETCEKWYWPQKGDGGFCSLRCVERTKIFTRRKIEVLTAKLLEIETVSRTHTFTWTK